MIMQTKQRMDDEAMGTGRCDKAFFSAQVDAKLDHFFSAALRLTRNRADAEDLVAESIMRAWANIESLQDTNRFVPWVLRIITNTFISERRKLANRTQHETYCEEVDDESPFSIFEKLHQPFLLWFGNPEQEFLNNLLQEDIQKALDGLPENYRIMIILADMEGLAYQEIAEALEVPVGTVRSRLSRARSQLQKCLWQHAQDRDIVSEPSQEKDHE